MEQLFGQLVFAIGNTEYNWEDVVFAARIRGDWTRLENELRQGLACLKCAEANSFVLPTHEVTLEANAFRYQRNLITAEETENWLKQWQLSVDTWMGYIRRALLRKTWADNLSEIISKFPVSDDEIAASIWSEAICSGYLALFARTLAGRAAVYEKLNEGSADGINHKRVEGRLEALLEKAASSDLKSQPGQHSERLITLARQEASFDVLDEQFLTPGAIGRCIAANRIDWIKIGFDYVLFAGEDAAREGALCVREDLMPLEAVAADAQQPMRHAYLFIEELAAELKSTFLACAVGELLGPVRWEGNYALCWVTEKTMPDEAEPKIKKRAEQSVIDSLVVREISNRVVWRIVLE